MTTLAEIRRQHPGAYDDLSDQELASKLHAKFYADMPVDQFNAKVGLAAAPAAPATPRGPGPLAGAPTKQLAGQGAGGLTGATLPYLDQLFRTLGGAAGDTADAVTGAINNPINSILRATGVDYQLPVNQVGSKVPQPVGAVSQFARGAAPYLFGPAAELKAAAAVSPTAKAAIAARPVVAGAVAGAGADAALSGVNDGNLSNLVNDTFGLNIPLARQESDSPGVAALKDMAEGGVIGSAVEGAVKFFARGGHVHPAGTPEAAAEEAAVQQAVADPVQRAEVEQKLRELGVTPETAPEKYQQFAARVQAVEEAQAARAADPNANVEPPSFRPPPRPEGAPRATPAEMAGARVDQTIDYRAQQAAAMDDLAARTQLPPTDPAYIDPAALPTAGRDVAPPEAPLRVTPQGQAFSPTEGALRGQELRQARNLPVPIEQPVPRMSDAEVVRARAQMEGGNPRGAAEPGPVAREPLPAQPDAQFRGGPDMQPERSVAPAAPREQRALPAPEAMRVTPEGQAFDPRGDVPGAARPAEGTAPAEAAPAGVDTAASVREDIAAAPVDRRAAPNAEDAEARSEPAVRGTKGATGADTAVEAIGEPRGRSHEPASRSATADELIRRYEQSRREPEDRARREAAAAALDSTELRSSSATAAPAEDGSFPVDRFGYVKSDKGGPIRFGEAGQAAKWIVNRGHKTSPHQVFEIVDEPRRGISVRQVGESTLNHEVVNEPAPPAGKPARRDDGGGQPEVRTEAAPTPPIDGAAPASDADNIDAPRQQANAGTKLYSGLDPEAIDEHLVQPLRRVIDGEVRAMRKDKAWLDRAFDGIDRAPQAMARDALSLLMRTVREGAMSGAGALRSYAKKYKDVPELVELADALSTDPGSGRAIGEPYEMAAVRQAESFANRARNIIEDWEKAGGASEAIRRAMTGGAPGSHAPYARRLRKLLDEFHAYQRAAGVDVGYVRDYFPRIPEPVKVERRRAEFVDAATKLYRSEGVEDPGAAAAAWADEIINGPELHAFRGANGSLTVRSSRERRFRSNNADRVLTPFMTDASATLTNYFAGAARHAEFARRFGPRGDKLDKLFEGMASKGVDARDLQSIRFIADGALGLLPSTAPNGAAIVGGWIHTVYTARLLAASVSSSLTEPFVLGVRTGDIGLGLRALGDYLAAPLDGAAHKQWRERAELMGVLGDLTTDALLLRRAGADGVGQGQRVLLNRFFRTIGLTPLTEFQLTTATKLGHWHLKSLLGEIDEADNAPTLRALADLYGLDEAAARQMQAWMASFGERPPSIADLLGASEPGRRYAAALNRFAKEGIQSPNRIDRPALANDPRYRLIYGITSFMTTFTRKVLVKADRDVQHALTAREYTTAQRIAGALGPSLAYGLYVAMQYGVWSARDHLRNPERAGERTKAEKFYTALSQGQVFRNGGPLIDAAMGAAGRYDRDLTSAYAGPQATTFLSDAQRVIGGLAGGSDRTNNAEWQGVRSGYNLLALNAFLIGSQFIPVGPLGRVGLFAGVEAATAPGTSRKVADSLVGERTVKPNAGRRHVGAAAGSEDFPDLDGEYLSFDGMPELTTDLELDEPPR